MWTICPICGAIAAKFDVHLEWHADRDERPPEGDDSAPVDLSPLDAPEASS